MRGVMKRLDAKIGWTEARCLKQWGFELTVRDSIACQAERIDDVRGQQVRAAKSHRLGHAVGCQPEFGVGQRQRILTQIKGRRGVNVMYQVSSENRVLGAQLVINFTHSLVFV